MSQNFQLNLVNYMKAQGYKVLSEHVALQEESSRLKKMSENCGINIPKKNGYEKEIREADIKWVDAADIFVAIVDGPSLGVGTEIERALLREERGLKPCKMLALVHESNLDNLSAMVKGIVDKNFNLMTYKNEADALKIVSRFLA